MVLPPADQVLQEEVIDVLNRKFGNDVFTLGRVFSTSVSIENFVGIWQMRRPRTMALAAGTVFELHKDGPWQEGEVQVLQQLMYGGAGDRTEEGFGQLRRWNIQDLTMAAEGEKEELEEPSSYSLEVKKRVAAILESRIKEQLHNFAYEDAAQLKGLEGGAKTHIFARLESCSTGISTKNSVKKRVKTKLWEPIFAACACMERHSMRFSTTNSKIPMKPRNVTTF